MIETSGERPLAESPKLVHKIVDVKCPALRQARHTFRLENLEALTNKRRSSSSSSPTANRLRLRPRLHRARTRSTKKPAQIPLSPAFTKTPSPQRTADNMALDPATARRMDARRRPSRAPLPPDPQVHLGADEKRRLVAVFGGVGDVRLDKLRNACPPWPKPSQLSVPASNRSISFVASIMIVMALDHTRDFFGRPGSPTNLATASAALFFTRWITNFCAPVFFLLTGTGAWLSLRKQSAPELSRFLFTRGLWLIFLELVLSVVSSCSSTSTITSRHHVLWALGWAMIVLSALVHLPPSVVTGFGVVMIATHNLFDSVRSSNPLWSILHSPNIILSTPTHTVFVAYPLIPWIGVTAVGYGLGQIYGWASDRRRTFLLRLGIGLTIGFVVIRAQSTSTATHPAGRRNPPAPSPCFRF